jgi:hypothetical protein
MLYNGQRLFHHQLFGQYIHNGLSAANVSGANVSWANISFTDESLTNNSLADASSFATRSSSRNRHTSRQHVSKLFSVRHPNSSCARFGLATHIPTSPSRRPTSCVGIFRFDTRYIAATTSRTEWPVPVPKLYTLNPLSARDLRAAKWPRARSVTWM